VPHVRQVTRDADEAARLFQSFLRSRAPNLEGPLRSFLADEAASPRRALERRLEWLLAAYRFAAPFAALALGIRLLSCLNGDGDGPPRHAAPPAAPRAAPRGRAPTASPRPSPAGDTTRWAPPTPAATPRDDLGAPATSKRPETPGTIAGDSPAGPGAVRLGTLRDGGGDTPGVGGGEGHAAWWGAGGARPGGAGEVDLAPGEGWDDDLLSGGSSEGVPGARGEGPGCARLGKGGARVLVET